MGRAGGMIAARSLPALRRTPHSNAGRPHHPCLSLSPPLPSLVCLCTYMMMVALLHVVDGRAGCRRVHATGRGKELGGREQVEEPQALGYYASAHGCLCCGW